MNTDQEKAPVKTTQEWIERFGRDVTEEDLNVNCLVDKACPQCGNRHSFNILADVVAHVCDDGVNDTRDIDWNENHGCWCRACGHSGIVDGFTFDGLDDALNARINQEAQHA